MGSKLHMLNQLRSGSLPTVSFTRALVADRHHSLEISKTSDLEDCHKFPINALSLDPVEGRYLLSGGTAGQIYVHDTLEQGSEGSLPVVAKIPQATRYAHKYSVETVQWFPTDTGTFTSSSMDTTLKLWDTNRLKPVFLARFNGRVYKHHQSRINCNLVLLATDESHAQILDLNTSSKTHMLSGAHTGRVVQCKWSPVVEHLCVTGGSDGRVCLWDVRYTRGHLAALDIDHTNQQKANHHLAHHGKVMSIEFSADGLELLTYGMDFTVRIWDIALAKNRRINFGRITCESAKGVQMALAEDGSSPILFIPSEKSIRMYDASSGVRLNILRAHLDTVSAVSYCNYTNRLFSAGADRSILLWTNEVELEEDSKAKSEAIVDRWSDSDD